VIPGSIGARYEGGETVAEIARSLGLSHLFVGNVLRGAGLLSDERICAAYEEHGTYGGAARAMGISSNGVKSALRRCGLLVPVELVLDTRPRCSRCGIILAECGPARDEWGTPTDDPPHVDGVCWACRRELAFEQEHSVEIAALYEAMEVVA